MADPRQGRAGAAGHSPRLGARDPRLRTNAAGQVGDSDHGDGLDRDAQGRTRVSVLDGIPFLSAQASLPTVIEHINLILKRARGGSR